MCWRAIKQRNQTKRNILGLGFHRCLLKSFIQDIWWQYEPPHDKTNKLTVCSAKTQISLGIHPVWSESSLCAQWVAKDPSFLHVDSKDSDQTGCPGWSESLLVAHVGMLVLSRGGSYLKFSISFFRLTVLCWTWVTVMVSCGPVTRKANSISLMPEMVYLMKPT